MRYTIHGEGGAGMTVARRAGAVFPLLTLLVLMGVVPTPASAQEQEPELQERVEELEEEVQELRAMLDDRTDTTDVAELRRRLDALTRQLEELQLGREVVRADTSVYGFGPAASKVYRVGEGVSIGGYGEVVYENFSSTREDGTPSGETDQLDALRGIVYVGYRFNDRIVFNSEIEFEHASTGQAGSASLEFAYLDYRISDAFGVRAGLLLPPVGFINELHEPPTFLGVNRPEVEQAIIPTTWRENGIGFFGGAGDFEYRAYVVNGLDAVGGGSSNAGGFSASGLRGGRQKGSKAVAEDFAGVGRVDYAPALGLRIGSSLYVGESGHNRVDSQGREIGARTLIWEGHAEYRARGFDLRGLGVLATVDDPEQINDVRGLTGQESVGEELRGFYLQAGYDVLRPLGVQDRLTPYVRFEQLNTQAEVPGGFSADPATDRQVVVVGAEWKPIPRAVLKLDYEFRSNEADTGVDQLNAAVGYLF